MSNIWQSVAVKESKIIGIRPIKLTLDTDEDAEQKAARQAETEHYQYIQDAKAEAEQILLAAQQAVDEQKSQWESKKQELMEQAQLEGYQKGFDAGQNEGLQSYQSRIDEAKHLIELAQQDYKETVETSEDALLDLGLKLAEKILHQQLEAEPESYLALVKGAIADWKERSDLRLYVHPDSYELVLQQKEELALLTGKDFDLMIMPQHDLPAGGCILETKHGRIDASIDSQLAVLREKLFELRREESK
ncbi:flagellar assembly protein FliH [Terribacillus halophilus]|uniref:flagellar assembly protein FliH n=1 Tax=Terribacillus halophilus TaxID=361279 RepID=UPI00147D18D7|nr:flagellar assembly protein FliH [Terribacillus halophilus]